MFLGRGAAVQRLAFVPVTQARVDDLVREHAIVWTVAHELRQPLSAMSTAVAVVEHDSPSVATAHAIAVMGRQLRHMSRMVDDLLDAARLSSGKMALIPELLDVREVMADAAADIARGGRQTRPVRGRDSVAQRRCGSMPTGNACIRCSRICCNNAIKFTGRGDRITFTADSHASTIDVRVRDAGRGIEPQALPRIFDLFAQVQPSGMGGLGIGLSVVREIVSLHRGRIEARSDGLGKGSEFVVTLPVLPAGRS